MKTRIIAISALTLLLALPMTVSAQLPPAPPPSNGGGGGGGSQSDLPLPRNNVKGGALSANRPGQWIQSGIATHVERNNQSLKNFGGASFRSFDQLEPTFQQQLVPALADSLLSTFNNFITALQAALTLNPAATAP